MAEDEAPRRQTPHDQEIRRRGDAWPHVIRRAFEAGLLFATFLLNADYVPLPGSHWHGIRSEVIPFIARTVFFESRSTSGLVADLGRQARASPSLDSERPDGSSS